MHTLFLTLNLLFILVLSDQNLVIAKDEDDPDQGVVAVQFR